MVREVELIFDLSAESVCHLSQSFARRLLSSDRRQVEIGQRYRLGASPVGGIRRLHGQGG